MSGSWNILEAISSRWDAKQLPEAISGYWDDTSKTSRYLTLYEDEATEGAPKPYVVYEHSPQTSDEMMNGPDHDHLFVIGNIEINFRVHAVDKVQAVDVAKLVVAAFDNAVFEAGESAVLGMRRAAEFGSRDGEEGYLWSIRYRIVDSHKQVISD